MKQNSLNRYTGPVYAKLRQASLVLLSMGFSIYPMDDLEWSQFLRIIKRIDFIIQDTNNRFIWASDEFDTKAALAFEEETENEIYYLAHSPIVVKSKILHNLQGNSWVRFNPRDKERYSNVRSKTKKP